MGETVDAREILERELDEVAASLSDGPFAVLVDVANALARLDVAPASNTARST